jgi:septal ring factor EnvC (AmiA/AmiB activator)
VVELHHVSDECQQLKSTLNKVESECVTAQSEVRNLSGKVRNLECVLEEMHKAAENRREIERQHKEVISLNFIASSHFIRTLHITIPLIISLHSWHS